MSEYQSVMERIQSIECPTGELDKKIINILSEYNVAARDEIQVIRDRDSDRNGAEAYRVEFGKEGQAIIVLARSGADDYVARVTDIALLEY